MSEKYKNCPYCGEEIKKEAIKCRFCGEWLNENQKNSYIDNEDNSDSYIKEKDNNKIMNNNSKQVDKKTNNINLIKSATEGDLEETKKLINEGADVNSKDHNGTTPLIGASFGGYKEIVRFLLENGANIDQKDNMGNSSIDMAKKQNNTDIKNYLLDKKGSFYDKKTKIGDRTNEKIFRDSNENVLVIKNKYKYNFIRFILLFLFVVIPVILLNFKLQILFIIIYGIIAGGFLKFKE